MMQRFALPGLLLCASTALAEPVSLRGYVEGVADNLGLNQGQAVWQSVPKTPTETYQAVADATLGLHYDELEAVIEGYTSAGQHTASVPPRAYQAYATYTSPGKEVFLKAGKSIPSWGVGQIWNPVRGITNEGRRDLVFPGRAIEGIYLLQGQYVLSENASVSAYVFPKREQRPAGQAIRVTSAIDDFDYAVSVYQGEGGARRAGAEFSWVLGPASVVAELAWSNRADGLAVAPDGARLATGRDALSYVLGTNIALPDDFQLSLETYHNGQGFTASQARAFASHLLRNLDLYNPLGNGQDNLFASISRHFTKRNSTLSLAAFHNVQSEVTVLRLGADTRVLSGCTLSLSVSRYFEQQRTHQINLYSHILDLRLRRPF